MGRNEKEGRNMGRIEKSKRIEAVVKVAWDAGGRRPPTSIIW